MMSDVSGARVGYVGLGDMGGALATRLASQRSLEVFDLNPSAVADLEGKGASAASSLESLAGESDVLFLCLPTSEHVLRVAERPGGIAEAMTPGSVVIDQTTGDPRVTRRLSKVLGEKGIELVDAPVSGGPSGALAGTIAIMVGAEAARFQALEPLLNEISPNVFHAGPLGAGHTMKIINNLVSCAQRLLSWEALTLAAKQGVDPLDALPILQSGGARNAYLENQAPKILRGEPSAGFTLRLAHKDVRLANELGSDAGVPTFFAGLTQDLYQLCMNEVGADAGCDLAGSVLDRLAGTSIVPATVAGTAEA
jgi:3-hydroxyisobutyrate dehydrogenase